MTKALEADKLDDELRADFPNLDQRRDHEAHRESAPVQAVAGRVARDVVGVGARRRREPLEPTRRRNEWLLSEYALGRGPLRAARQHGGVVPVEARCST
jgi:hypothetical protein